MTNFIQNRGNFSSTINTNRLLSPNIWAGCPIEHLQAQRLDGKYFFDDFHTLASVTEADDVGAEAPYPYYWAGSDGVTLAKLADTDQGVARVAGTDADEDGSVLVLGNAAGWMRFGIGDMVWFEARHSQASVADSNAVTFLGAVEVNVVPTSVITQVDATGVLDASEDFIGWSSLAADGDALRAIYQLGGQTLAHVGSGSTNATGSGTSSTLTASTFLKSGFRWTGPDRLLEFYENGLLKAWYQVPASSTTFPFVNHLAMCWATKTTAATEVQFDLDWWAGAA